MKKIFTTLSLILALSFSTPAFANNAYAKETTDYIHEITATNGLTLKSTHKFASVKNADEIRFAVFYNNEDVTAQSKVYFLNLKNFAATLVADNKFVFSEAGSHVFWAEYGDLSSKNNTLTITAYNDIPALPADSDPDSLNFARRLLLVQNTGTMCGYCPNAIGAIRKFNANSDNADKVELVAAHSYTSSDPLYCSAATILTRMTGYSSFPSIMFNFNKSYGMNGATESNFEKFINNTTKTLLLDNSSTGISLTTKYDEETGTISVSTGIKTDSAGIFRVTVALIQDNVYAYQYGAPSEDYYLHHAGVRALSPSSGAGEKLNGNVNSIVGKTYQYACEFKASSLVQASEGRYTLDIMRDARIVVFVTDANNFVDNVASCSLNASQAFSYTHAPTAGIHGATTTDDDILRTIIYDITGKPVCTLPDGNYKNANLPRGIYIANLQSAKGSRSVKFVKQ